jgi:hypothetical protein
MFFTKNNDSLVHCERVCREKRLLGSNPESALGAFSFSLDGACRSPAEKNDINDVTKAKVNYSTCWRSSFQL